MPKRTTDYRAGLLEELRDPGAAANYLTAALEDSDAMFLTALRDVAEARQMSRVAATAGLSRENLYRMLSGRGNPRYSSLIAVLNSLGLRLSVETMPPRTRRRPAKRIRGRLEWAPFLRQPVKLQNPLNGEWSHGIVSKEVHQGV